MTQWNAMTKDEECEIVNLYHTARIPLAGKRDEAGRLMDTRYNRMIQAARWFSEKHPEVTITGAYKALDRALEPETILDQEVFGEDGTSIGFAVPHPRMAGYWLACWKPRNRQDSGLKRYKTRQGAIARVRQEYPQ